MKCPATSIELGLPDGALLDEIVEGANRGPVRVLQRGQRLRGRAREIPVLAHAVEDGVSRAHRRLDVFDHHLGEQASFIAGQPLSQPCVNDLAKQKVHLTPVRHPRARVDVRLDGIGFHQALAEAVDGRAGDLVDGLRGNNEILPLLRGKSVREACLQFRGNLVGEERRDEIPNPRKKFAGGHLGESDGRDRLWRNPAREQHCDAPRHDRGLP